MNIINLKNKVKSNIYALNSLYVFFIINSTNVLSYLFWFLIGRNFNEETFTFITSINSLLMILTTPAATLAHLIVKFLNFDDDKKIRINFFFNLLFIISLLFILLSSIIFIFFDVFFSKMNYLRLHIILILAACFFIYLKHLITSFFQLKKNYVKFSLFQSSFIYLKFFLMLFVIYFGINGKFGFIYVNLIAVIIVLFFLFFWFNEDFKLISFFKIYDKKKYLLLSKYFIILFGSSFFITFLLNYDLIISRAYFETNTSAEYSSLSIICKSIFYLFSVFIFVIFPESSLDKSFKIKKFLILIIFSLILGSIAIFTLVFFSDIIFYYTFNGKYQPNNTNIIYLSYSMLFLTISNLIYFFLIGKNKYLIPMLIFILPFLFYSLVLKYFTESIFTFVQTQFFINLIMMSFIASYFFYIKIKKL